MNGSPTGCKPVGYAYVGSNPTAPISTGFSEPNEVSGAVVAVHTDGGVEGWSAATGKTR
jgi:hypothetical protein